MDDLLEQFLIEGRDLIAQAAADLDTLRRDPKDAAAIDSAFRAIHTLKGSVGIFPMGPAERVLHAAEEVLERARKARAMLDAATIAAIVGCLDAIDRWVDDLEGGGALSPDAEAVAAAAIARLPGADPAASEEVAPAPSFWVHALIERERGVLQGATTALTAFRYTPDAECFFRGEDPLAVVAGVPEIVALAVLPIGGSWPTLAEIDPFVCTSIIEGLSAAAIEAVQAAFRMMPDQVAIHPIAPFIDAQPESVGVTGHAAATLRVDAARIDALADGLGELVVAVNAFAPLAEQADAIDRDLAARIRAVQAGIERAASDLHRGVSAVRLVPLAPTLRRLPRMVREIAASLGKQVAFTMSGERLEVDKQVADGLFEPLLHLVRNAVDHGIEAPGDRETAGKSAAGRITLTASRDGDAILLVLADDGAGIDADRIRGVAATRGLIGEEAAAQLSDAAALRLIFTPGFSTAAAVTEVSGRGVGMDAVLTAVDRLRGTIEIESAPGAGTRFLLRLPANALTTRLLIVEIGGDRYGVPLDQIVETVRVDTSALMPVGGGRACVLRGRTVPVLSLAALLGVAERSNAATKLLVTRSGGENVALTVDGFAERVDTLVRPSSGILAGVPGVTGSTLLGDGDVLLVLDLPALAA
ncbi:chemotaxis protein CheA [Sphingomonas immobilis]|uniref:histidine kinase n=1 Tax=Sphingomonas immobilis TaxID=3063997 RepID=A0ABT8ZXQ3_9SPHN|nr:chemotaxis protein CheA [Sphingomonas sp. CA1-15]MDO7841790.1 chemotaxis protein CheA [Sphingomonas sp. CA1-15]